jgi:hypothetical protein
MGPPKPDLAKNLFENPLDLDKKYYDVIFSVYSLRFISEIIEYLYVPFINV